MHECVSECGSVSAAHLHDAYAVHGVAGQEAQAHGAVPLREVIARLRQSNQTLQDLLHARTHAKENAHADAEVHKPDPDPETVPRTNTDAYTYARTRARAHTHKSIRTHKQPEGATEAVGDA